MDNVLDPGREPGRGSGMEELRRLRRRIWFGAFFVLVVGWALLGWSSMNLPLSVSERAALLAMPVPWAGVLAVAAIIGSPHVRRRELWAAVIMAGIVVISVTAAVVVKPALNAVRN